MFRAWGLVMGMLSFLVVETAAYGPSPLKLRGRNLRKYGACRTIFSSIGGLPLTVKTPPPHTHTHTQLVVVMALPVRLPDAFGLRRVL
jgi:hypothetical protein